MNTKQWVMVLSKAPHQNEFGLNKAFSVDQLGADAAMKQAQEFMDGESRLFKNIAFKIQRGER
jgi:hypothetical protein